MWYVKQSKKTLPTTYSTILHLFKTRFCCNWKKQSFVSTLNVLKKRKETGKQFRFGCRINNEQLNHSFFVVYQEEEAESPVSRLYHRVRAARAVFGRYNYCLPACKAHHRIAGENEELNFDRLVWVKNLTFFPFFRVGWCCCGDYF